MPLLSFCFECGCRGSVTAIVVAAAVLVAVALVAVGVTFMLLWYD